MATTTPKLPIILNFLSLSDEPIKFEVFRRQSAESVKEEDTFVYRLPTSENGSEYDQFRVSFTQKNDFDSFLCDGRTNLNLTQKFLQHSLIQAVSSAEILHTFGKRTFSTYVDFVLEELKEGQKLVTVTPYYFRRQEKFGFLLDYRFRKNPDISFNREVQRLSLSLNASYRANTKYYTDKFHILTNFIDRVFLPLFPLTYGKTKIQASQNLEQVDAGSLGKRTYVFRGDSRGSSQYMGLKQHGPYRGVNHDVHYAFLFESKFRDFANDIYLGLLGKKFGGLFAGISSLFGLNLQKSDVSRISLSDYSQQSLAEAHAQVLKIQESVTGKQVVAIFLTPEEEVPTEDSTAYFYLKHLFAGSKVPLQVVNHEHLGNYNTLKWSLANIGLQIFCKLGGIPWRVVPSNEKCLIIGLGSAHRYNDDGTVSKYFGYSVCLDSSGVFKKINVLAYHEKKSEYLRHLREELKTSILADVGSDYRKCVLHLPFKIQREEIAAIRDCIKEVSAELSIGFRVIKINTENKFFGFSPHNTRIPYESTCLRLSNNEYLAWFEGLQYGKENVHKKVGNPVHIEFLRSDEETDDEDRSYLQDIINLSGANWRGFNSKLVPISIYYASLIAGYAKEFEEIEDLDSIKGEISSIENPWFL